MSKFERARALSFFVAIVAAGATMAGGPATGAVIYQSGELTFATANQSMWGSGGATVIDKSFFLGTQWNTPTATLGEIFGSQNTIIVPGVGSTRVTIPCISIPIIGGCVPGTGISFTTPAIPPVTADTRTGATVTAQTSGKIGLNLGFKADSGSVDATVGYDAALALPETFTEGTFFNLNPDSLLAGASAFATNFPDASAKLDVVFGVKATIGGTACLAPFGCTTGAPTTIGFDPITQELVAFNQDGDGAVRVLGLDGLTPNLPFAFGEEIKIPPNNPLANVGDVTVHLPDINTADTAADGMLASTGMDDFIDLRADLDGIALLAFGLPTALEAEIDIGPVTAGYNLVDVELGPTIEVIQEFDLTPTLMTRLDFSGPVNVAGLGLVSSLISAWDLLPDIALVDGTPVIVTPTFFLEVDFRNQTRLGIDGVFTLDAFSAEFGISAFGLSYDLGELGPLFAFELRGDLFDTPNIIDQTFALMGFGASVGPAFTLGVDAADRADIVAELVTASAAVLSQEVTTPAAAWDLVFDYFFETGVGELTVTLGDLELGMLAADPLQFGFATASFSIADAVAAAGVNLANFLGSTRTLAFSFLHDVPGAVLLLDDIVFKVAGLVVPGIGNGDFQVLGDRLNDWATNGHVRAVAFAAVAVPAPGLPAPVTFAMGLALIAAARALRGPCRRPQVGSPARRFLISSAR